VVLLNCHADNIYNFMMNYSYVIWDWNGTIVDDAQLCVDIVNRQLISYDLNEVTLDYYVNNFRFPVRSYYKRVGLPTDTLNYSKIAAYFINEYRKRYKFCNIHQGAIECFNKLNLSGVNQSVLSASMESDLYAFILHFKLNNQFTHFSGTSDIFASGKSNISIEHLKKINSNNLNVLLVGDTLHDAEVAQKLDVDCLLFSGGHNSREILSESNYQIVDSFNEIYQYILD
jgi:phosphoglycolate phosphatase